MYNPNLTLEELFKPNSLRNLRTEKQCPMPHSAPTYFIAGLYNVRSQEIKDILEKGNKWIFSAYSINSYIDLSERANELITSRLIELGPQSNSSSLKLEFNQWENEEHNIRIIAQGWGSSSIELYDGSSEAFLEYLKTYQQRGEK